EVGYIYVRGEFTEPFAIMAQALDEASKAGILGDLKIYLVRGAGAYICGEETALMNSIDGKRGNPRIKPPFPAAAGAFGLPTTINNVETLAAVPPIRKNGAAWYTATCLSNRKSTGTKTLSVGGHAHRPGKYEATLGCRPADLPGTGEVDAPRAPARPRREHDRQDDLRTQRFVRRAGRLGDQEVPGRVRGVPGGAAQTRRGGVNLRLFTVIGYRLSVASTENR